MARLSRRDFLKLAALVPGALAAASLAKRQPASAIGEAAPPNIVILLFDAMSASNLSVYGYGRKTTPNLERFAERATVYHAHHSAGNFTNPGVASLLTGTYPWTHRAFDIVALVKRDLVDHNIFRALGEGYKRLAFSQNPPADYYFNQFGTAIDTVLPVTSFSTLEQAISAHVPFDVNAIHSAFDGFLFDYGGPPGSMVFGPLEGLAFRRQMLITHRTDYPRGLPHIGEFPLSFELARVMEGITATIEGLQAPYFAYLHVYSPHAPYRAAREFTDIFLDKFKPVRKPNHPLGQHVAYAQLNARRKNYDEYLANIDAEFGKLIDRLEAQGVLDKTWFIFTADHGESFERGQDGHITALLYEPLIHVPLLISAPGQRTRNDIYSPTNSVDVLPTLLQLAGREIPDWCEGTLLPGLGGTVDPERATYSVEAKESSAFGPLKIATFAMRKGQYKLIYYTGYGSADAFELYDVQADPEELTDLYAVQTAIADAMREELLAKVRAVNLPYQH